MKKILLILALILPLFVAAAPSAMSDTSLIPVRSIRQGGEILRSPAQIPLMCAVDTDIPCIFVSFLDDLGDVDIVLENQTTGEYSLTSVDSATGGAIIPFSGSSGTWIIIFTLVSGDVFEGEFEL